jgi:hypothetical protein
LSPLFIDCLATDYDLAFILEIVCGFLLVPVRQPRS